MNDFIGIAGMFFLGGGIAAAWLFGLWLDVRSLASHCHPYRRLLAGALLRLTVVAAGLYLVITGAGHWSDLLAALAGFMLVRFVVLAATRRRVAKRSIDTVDQA